MAQTKLKPPSPPKLPSRTDELMSFAETHGITAADPSEAPPAIEA